MINYVIGFAAIGFLVWMAVRQYRKQQLRKAQKEFLSSCSGCCSSCSSTSCH